MDNIVGELIKIEERARDITRNSNAMFEEYKHKAQEYEKEICKHITLQTEKKIAEAQDNAAKELAAKLNIVDSTLEADLIEVRRVFENNRADYETRIFNKIIGGQTDSGNN